MEQTNPPPTLLAIYLDRFGIPNAVFAQQVNLSPSYISLLRARKRIPGTVAAVAIERATRGLVPASSWIPLPDLLAAQ